MKILKYILIFIFVFIQGISFVSAKDYDEMTPEEKCIEYTEIEIDKDSVLKSLNPEDREEFVLCLTGVEADDDTNEYETHGELMEDGSLEDVKFASQEDIKILEKKKNLLKLEDRKLNYEDVGDLITMKMGVDCGGKLNADGDEGVITCMRDMREYEFILKQEEDGFFGGAGTMMDLYSAKFVNGTLKIMSWMIGKSTFGYSKIDELPEFEQKSTADMFDTTTVSGMVNSLSLMILAFIILWYFLKMGTGKGGDGYKIFMFRAIFVFIFMFSYYSLYAGLQNIITAFENGLINGLQGVSDIPLDIARNGITMDLFKEGAMNTITGYFIFGILGLLLLLVISLIVIIRDIFIIGLMHLFFLSAIGFLGGTMKDNDIFTDAGFLNKTAKRSTQAMFWIIAVFITIVLIIIATKFITVILAIIPSIEVDGVSIIGNIGSFSLDAFLYLLVVFILLVSGFWKLLPIVYDMVEGFMKKIFFPQSQSTGGYNDFTKEMSDGFTEMKIEEENLRKNNPVFKKVTDSVSSGIGKAEALAKQNKNVKNISEYMNEKQTGLRGKMKSLGNSRVIPGSNITTKQIGKAGASVLTGGLVGSRKSLKETVGKTVGMNVVSARERITKESEYIDKQLGNTTDENRIEKLKTYKSKLDIDSMNLESQDLTEKQNKELQKLDNEEYSLQQELEGKDLKSTVKRAVEKVGVYSQDVDKMGTKRGIIERKIDKVQSEKIEKQYSYDVLIKKNKIKQLEVEKNVLKKDNIDDIPKIEKIEKEIQILNTQVIQKEDVIKKAGELQEKNIYNFSLENKLEELKSNKDIPMEELKEAIEGLKKSYSEERTLNVDLAVELRKDKIVGITHEMNDSINDSQKEKFNQDIVNLKSEIEILDGDRKAVQKEIGALPLNNEREFTEERKESFKKPENVKKIEKKEDINSVANSNENNIREKVIQEEKKEDTSFVNPFSTGFKG